MYLFLFSRNCNNLFILYNRYCNIVFILYSIYNVNMYLYCTDDIVTMFVFRILYVTMLTN